MLVEPVHAANVTLHHEGVQSKYAEPQEGFTLELPLRLQWMQTPPSSLINKRYFQCCWWLIPLGTTSPQADKYKPLWFNALIPWSLSIVARLHSIDHCFWILRRSYLETVFAVLVHINKLIHTSEPLPPLDRASSRYLKKGPGGWKWSTSLGWCERERGL